MNKTKASALLVLAVVLAVGAASWLYANRATIVLVPPRSPAPAASSTSAAATATKPAAPRPAAAKPVLPAATKPAATTFTVGLDQTGSLLGVAIKPVAVLEDSRCPAGVACIQAGTVRVNTDVVAAGSTFSNHFTLGEPTAIVGGWTVTLVSVSPARVAGGVPPSADYRFTFKVEKR